MHMEVVGNILKSIQYLLGNYSIAKENLVSELSKDELTYRLYIYAINDTIQLYEKEVLNTIFLEVEKIKNELDRNKNSINRQERFKALFRVNSLLPYIFFASLIKKEKYTQYPFVYLYDELHGK